MKSIWPYIVSATAIALVICSAAVYALSPTVRWYTNTDLANNQRIMAPYPSVFSGFYFCCGQFEFTYDGKFTFRNSSDLLDNIKYFQSTMNSDFKMYIVGGVENSSVFSVNSTILNSQFTIAAQTANEIGIDGFLLDYEPSVPSNQQTQVAGNYSKFLGDFKQVLNDFNSNYGSRIEIGCDIAGWGILDYFNSFKTANLDIYTSMTPTYYGTNIAENEEYVNQELEYFTINQLRSGVGSMLTSYPSSDTWNYNWTQSRFTQFLTFLKNNASVPSVDIWRADIDHNGYNTTDWFYQCLDEFVSDNKYSRVKKR